jgi:GR25 family glycosyltransferase involved in LPS biosynthesis
MNININTPPDFFKGLANIYWINLERATDRREKMEKMFQEPLFKNIPIERINAFDGSKYFAIDFFKMDSEPKMTNIEYACLYSHLESVYNFSQKEGPDDEIALILEDDMTLEFKPYWRKPIQQIINETPSEWEIIQLTYIIDEHMPINEYTDIYLWSTGAYLIKKSAAKNLINKILINREPKIFNVTDYDLHQADYLIYMSKSYLYKYPVFIYEDDNISYLNKDNSLLLARNYSKNMIKKMMDFELVKK